MDHLGGSTIWDDPFEGDQEALDEAMRAIDEDGIESFAAAHESPEAKRGLWTARTLGGPIADVKQALDASDQMLDFHATCGVFAAVATAPETVPPSAWMELIKGGHVFQSLEEVQGFTNGLMALYNEVLRSVAEQGAHCVPGPDEHGAVRAFCEGYVAVAANDATWEANERVFVELLPMFALAGSASMDKIDELLPSAKEDPEGWLQKAREELPATVCTLYEVWAGARRAAADKLAERAEPLRREGRKVGRNDPCPCGSGRKYKKCCAK